MCPCVWSLSSTSVTADGTVLKDKYVKRVTTHNTSHKKLSSSNKCLLLGKKSSQEHLVHIHRERGENFEKFHLNVFAYVFYILYIFCTCSRSYVIIKVN